MKLRVVDMKLRVMGDEDTTLTVQCIFLAKSGLLTPDLYPSAYPLKIYLKKIYISMKILRNTYTNT